MPANVISVLTYKSVEHVLQDGGSQSWVLDRNRAASCKYVVLCRNARTRNPEGPESHGTAFLVGKVSGVVPATHRGDEGRWLITISEYALVEWVDAWEGRNPVAYWSTNDFTGIDFEGLDFKPLKRPVENVDVPALTIPMAKAGLAKHLQVDPDKIQISILA